MNLVIAAFAVVGAVASLRWLAYRFLRATRGEYRCTCGHVSPLPKDDPAEK